MSSIPTPLSLLIVGLLLTSDSPVLMQAQPSPEAALKEKARLAGQKHPALAKLVAGLVGYDLDEQIRALSRLKDLGAEARPVIPILLESHILGPRGDDQVFAVELLMELKAIEAAPDLVQLLGSESPAARRRATRLLGGLGAKGAASDVGKLLKDSAPGVRQAALEALSRLEAQNLAPEILECLMDTDEDVRTQCARTLVALSKTDLVTARLRQAFDRALMRSNEEDAEEALRYLMLAETTLRSQDLDGNGMNDYWTGDVAGLLNFKVGVERALAEADSAPLKPLVSAPKPLAGYLFRAMEKDEDGWPFAQSTTAGGEKSRHAVRFAFCTFPAQYGKSGVRTFIVDAGQVYAKDTEGKPLLQWPRDPVKEGWQRRGP